MNRKISINLNKVTFIGAGYVGIVNALGMASLGTEVWLVDNNEFRIEQLKKGISPIYEVDIDKYLKSPQVIGNIHYSTDITDALHNTDYVFITVGTPQSFDGSTDLSAVYAVAHAIGQKIDHNMTVVVKSTVPVGTTCEVEHIIASELSNRSAIFREKIKKVYTEYYIKKHPEIFSGSPLFINVGVANNPEFLKEGHAFMDFCHPDRIVIGTHFKDNDIRVKMIDLYTEMGFDESIIHTCNIQSAELIKYASNSMLAMRISFANVMADICSKTGADIDDVMSGVGKDTRIGDKFLQAGIGYGGSCFPKDVMSLRHQMISFNVDPCLLDATRNINYYAKQRPYLILRDIFNNLDNKTITIWGGAFKAGTDDIRESPFLDFIHNIRLFEGITVKVYDKLAGENLRKFVKNPDNKDEFVGNLNIEITDDIMDSVRNSDAILIMVPTDEYRRLDFASIKKVTNPSVYLIDCRNFYNYQEITNIINTGIHYMAIGRSGYIPILKW